MDEINNNDNNVRFVGKKPIWPFILLALLLLGLIGLLVPYLLGKAVQNANTNDTANANMNQMNMNAASVALPMNENATFAPSLNINSNFGFTNQNTLTPGTSGATIIISLNELKETSAASGRTANIMDLTVENVLEDRVFLIRDAQNNYAAAYLDTVLDAGTTEERIVVKNGQTVNLSGTVAALPSEDMLKTQWGLTTENIAAMKGGTSYIRVTNITFK
ncbi:MAG: hypothetical protein ACK4NC_05550 [Candidatus Gracilibacteria bacterium]